MKRVVLCLAVLVVLVVAVPVSAAQPRGEIEVSYVDSVWGLGGTLYISDRVTIGGSYIPGPDTDLSAFTVALGYDISQTESAYARISVGAIGVTESGTSVSVPYVGLSGRTYVSDMAFISGSVDYAFSETDSVFSYGVGLGLHLSDVVWIGVSASGLFEDADTPTVGVSIGLRF